MLAVALAASACSSTQEVRAVRAAPPTTTAVAATTTTSLPSAVPTTVPSPVVPVPGWSHPATTLPPAGGYTSVSCISDVFCLAAGGGANEADAAYAERLAGLDGQSLLSLGTFSWSDDSGDTNPIRAIFATIAASPAVGGLVFINSARRLK